MDIKTYESSCERIRKYEILKERMDTYKKYIKYSTLTTNRELFLGISGVDLISIGEDCAEKVILSIIEILKERVAEMEKEMEDI